MFRPQPSAKYLRGLFDLNLSFRSHLKDVVHIVCTISSTGVRKLHIQQLLLSRVASSILSYVIWMPLFRILASLVSRRCQDQIKLTGSIPVGLDSTTTDLTWVTCHSVLLQKVWRNMEIMFSLYAESLES